MPVCGWVVWLDEDPKTWSKTHETLALLPRVTVGEGQGSRLPLVTESTDPAHAHIAHRQLMAVPGVIHVDLAYSDLSDVESVSESVLRMGARRRGAKRLRGESR